MTLKKAIRIPGTATVIVLISVLIALFLISPKAHSQNGNDLNRSYILNYQLNSKKAPPLLPEGTRLPGGEPVTDTLTYFRALERHFAEKSLADLDLHFKKVNTYLKEQFKTDDAQGLFDLYKKYLNCEISINSSEKFKTTPSSSRDLLRLLSTIHEYRRATMGRDNADALFGREVKFREYQLRRSMILDDPTLYGKQKEALIQNLREGIWGDQTPPSEQTLTDYDRHQFKQKLYHKDLAEMNEKDRRRRIEDFRKECFSKEALERLHAADRQIAEQKETLRQYRLAEKNILAEKELTPIERNKKIQSLQDEFFGKDAEAFRRRETIYRDNQSRSKHDETP